MVDPGDRPGVLRVGAAEERLDRLLEEDREGRAASVPATTAAVRRLAAAPGQATQAMAGSSMRRTSREPEGRAVGRETGEGQVPNEAVPGLLDSVRQSLEVLQRAFGGNPQNQGLLAPLLHPHDLGHLAGSVSDVHGGHGSMVASPQHPLPPQGRPTSYGPGMEPGPQPRVLDPYSMTTPPQARGPEINPFWSTQAPLGAARSRSGLDPVPPGDVRRSPTHLEVEAIRDKVLKEAETLFAREIKKITGGGESSSFESVPSAGREQGKPRTDALRSGVGLEAHGHSLPPDQGGSQGHGLDCPPGLHCAGIQGPSTRSEQTSGPVNEVFRSLELPALPLPGSDGASLAFGDWLTVAMPLMSDLSASARGWWQANVIEAEALYETWLKLKPLERLRLKVERPVNPSFERVEHRGVTILLGVLPDQVRKDVIASRKVSCLGILFRLYTIFQPGGSAERTALLKSITDLKVGHGVADVLSGIRQWRRWIQRAQELNLATPDPLVLVQVLNRVTEALGRQGGAQVSFRMAAARQDLAVDQCPTMESIMEYAEYVQAEAEDLALVVGSSKGNTTGLSINTASVTGGNVPKVAAFNSAGATEEKPKTPCRFWGSTQGCRRGDQCTYGHSWESINKQNRCYVCSGEGHMSRECPTRKDKDQKDPKKVAKVKNTSLNKESPVKGTEDSDASKGSDAATTTTSQPSPASLKSSQASGSRDGEKEGGGGGASTGSTEATTALLVEATGLLKSLRALKACRLKQVCPIQPGSGAEQEVALLDGGATHPLRTAEPGEREHLIPVQVELAHGSTTLYRKEGCSTLLSLDLVEPIIPLTLLVHHGFQVQWSKEGCVIKHPRQGPIPCWLRGGCPVMNRRKALEMLREFEEMESQRLDLEPEDVAWWLGNVPGFPKELLTYMKGQSWNPSGEELPWNRRQRRSHQTAKGVIVHLFSGANLTRWKKTLPSGYVWLFLDTQLGSRFDLHSPHVWGYLCSLAKQGQLRAIIGGPPCRTTSRLRNKGPPGPRRV